MILGVIPVAGKGSRWGGYYKELLPCGKGEWLLDRTIKAMKIGGAHRICVVTSQEKIATHVAHITEKYDDVFYVIQKGTNDIYSAMEASFPYAGSINYFAMPDTYFDKFAFTAPSFTANEFYLGTFYTDKPERFGTIRGERVLNKRPSPSTEKGKFYEAWGAMVWSDKVSRLWKNSSPSNYTDAINSAMQFFGYTTFPLHDYKDMATWDDYTEFIKDRF